jgi:hypothetical protein
VNPPPLNSISYAAVVTVLGAAPTSNGGSSTVTIVGVVLTSVAVIVAALIGRKPSPPPPAPPPPPPPDPSLDSASAALVKALKTRGPARSERIAQSRLDLEKATAKLHERKQADARALAQQLAGCSDASEAAELRKQLMAQVDR